MATLDLDAGDDKRFELASHVVMRSLRETDTAAAICCDRSGKRLVLVLPGAGQEEANRATARLSGRIEAALSGRRVRYPEPETNERLQFIFMCGSLPAA